jgi:hypothetical protein
MALNGATGTGITDDDDSGGDRGAGQDDERGVEQSGDK